MNKKKILALLLVFVMVFSLGATAGTYQVKSGDVLWKIAKANNTTWQELAKLNNLKDPGKLVPGQILQLPGGETVVVPKPEPVTPPATPSVPADPTATSYNDTIKWDDKYDLVIVGFGLAGAAAAVEAYDINPNAKILIVEKMTEKLAGGNSVASGQTFMVPEKGDIETFKTYMRACNEPNPIPEDLLDWWSNEMADQIDWIQATVDEVGYEAGYVAGGPLKWGAMVVEFDDLPGSNFKGASAHLRTKGKGFETGGVWNAFAKVVKNRNIEVRYQTPAVALVQNPFTKEVLGITAKKLNGDLINIKGEKGTVLACGGFENNLEMQRDFHGMDEVYTSGTPGNTGDGVKMLLQAGAKMWHMNNQTQSGGFWLGIKVPDFESTFIRQMTFKTGSWIEIDAESNRFYDEATSYHRQHMKYKEHGRYVDLHHERALPVHLIFDENTRQNDQIITPWLSWPITSEGYVWSKDNQTELDKGWFIKADTIEELAKKIDRDPVELKATINRYNTMVDKGVDEDFGRDIKNMQKIEKGPYYAVSLTPTLVATTGGAKRDTNSRALDWDENPIKGLYTAGELGSYVSNLYQNGIFLSEAIVSGRAAAQHAFGGKSTAGEGGFVPKEEPVAEAPWAKAADGVYKSGGDSLTKGGYTISTTVMGGKITAIEVIEGKENMFMSPTQFSAFVKTIIAAQTPDVDVISGATVDCQTIQDALREIK